MNKKGLKKFYMAGWICIIAGIIFFCYFIIVLTYTGNYTGFGWFWAFLSLFFSVLGWFILQIYEGRLRVPGFLIPVCGVLLFFGLSVFLAIEALLIVNAQKSASPGADYMIVLGAQVKGTKISRALKNRLDTAVGYLIKNPDTIVIVSGGQGAGESVPEAEAMSEYLVKKGIDKSRIIEEAGSTNTQENILYSSRYIEGENKRIVIVTNGFHVYRGTAIAKKQNIGIIEGLGAPTDAVLAVSYYVREALAVVKDKLVGNI